MKKIALVTGSSSGFGYLTSKTLAEKGSKVYASMRNVGSKNAEKAKELEAWASENNVELEAIELDVTDPASVKNAIDTIISKEGQLDVVVNNAGGGAMGVLESYTIDEFKKTFEVNVYGVVNVTNAVVPHMREKGSGLIINVSSTLGRFVFPLLAPYNASKWAVEGLTQTLNAELGALGVDAVIVEPGAFPTTEFFNNMGPFAPANGEVLGSYGDLAGMPQMFSEMMGNMVASGQAPDPQQVADAVSGLVETPQGQRPLRTVVDFMLQDIVTEYNEQSVALQQQAMSMFQQPQE